MVALALALALLALLPAGAAGFLTPRLPPTSGRTPRAAAGACAMACEQTRRQFLHASCGGGAGTVVALQIIAPGATAAAEEEEEEEEDDDDRDASTAEQPGVPKLKLFSRFGKGQLKTLGPAGPLGPPEAIAPDWLEGDWDVTFKFRQATFPLTKDFAQFKQLLAGSIRSPGDAPGVATTTVLSWRSGPKAVEEDRAANLKNYYNAWSKDLTVDGQKGSRTRKVAWMPILTQRGVYEKVNSVSVSGANEFRMVVKEIAPDLSVVSYECKHAYFLLVWEQQKEEDLLLQSKPIVPPLHPASLREPETLHGAYESSRYAWAKTKASYLVSQFLLPAGGHSAAGGRRRQQKKRARGQRLRRLGALPHQAAVARQGQDGRDWHRRHRSRDSVCQEKRR